MAKPGYQAVALDAPVADTLRDVSHYLSLTSGDRVTLSATVAHLILQWMTTADLPVRAEQLLRERLATRTEYTSVDA